MARRFEAFAIPMLLPSSASPWLVAALWISVLGLGYIFVGYPLLVWIAARLRPRRPGPAVDVSNLTATVLIAAHNETDTLARKLRQLLDQPRVTAIRVGVDGAAPEVIAACESVGDDRVGVIPFPDRCGKPAILSQLIPDVATPVTVMADARQQIAADAIDALIERLADPEVGVVSGELVFHSSDAATAASEGVGAYWTYEKLIRKSEAAFRGVPGATGALYAIRTDLAHPIPGNTLLDDVVIPMQAVESGARCVFEPRAIVYDAPTTEPRKEAIRKRRTIAGAAQLAVAQPRWLLPWRNPIWWEFVSHKLARLLAPLLMVVALAANIAIVCLDNPTGNVFTVYDVLFVGQLLFYAAAFFGAVAQRAGLRLPLVSVPLMFVTLNGTTALALWDALRGRFTATWKRS